MKSGVNQIPTSRPGIGQEHFMDVLNSLITPRDA